MSSSALLWTPPKMSTCVAASAVPDVIVPRQAARRGNYCQSSSVMNAAASAGANDSDETGQAAALPVRCHPLTAKKEIGSVLHQ